MSDSEKIDKFDLAAGAPSIEGTLRPKPKFADRISKRVLAVGFVFIGVLVAIFLLSLDNMDKKPDVAPAPVADVKKSKEDIEAQNTVPPDLMGGGDGAPVAAPAGAVAAEIPKAVAAPSLIAAAPGAPASKIPPPASVPALGTAGAGGIPPDQGAAVSYAPPPLSPKQQALAIEKQARAQRQAQARNGGLVGKSFDGEGASAAGDAAGSGATEMAELLAAGKAAAASPAATGTGAAPGRATEQDEKLDFLKTSGKEERGYHPHLPMPAVSGNEIKAGTYINMTLTQGINSDIPGLVTAKVNEAVWDTMTGCRLLIPAMSTVIGKYDSKVALGQGRNLVVWSNLIDPDGSELNLAGMQGYDMNGEAGLKSEVNNHYFKLFGLAFGMSMITSAVQLSVPQPNPGVAGAAAPQTPAQTVATALAQQYGTLGAEIITKQMAVQPTLRNFSGERFMIVVPRTMIMGKVWRNRCQAKMAGK